MPVLIFTNNKMSSVMPFLFDAVYLYIVTINEKHWMSIKEIYKSTKYSENCTTCKGSLSSGNYRSEISSNQVRCL